MQFGKQECVPGERYADMVRAPHSSMIDDWALPQRPVLAHSSLQPEVRLMLHLLFLND